MSLTAQVLMHWASIRKEEKKKYNDQQKRSLDCFDDALNASARKQVSCCGCRVGSEISGNPSAHFSHLGDKSARSLQPCEGLPLNLDVFTLLIQSK